MATSVFPAAYLAWGDAPGGRLTAVSAAHGPPLLDATFSSVDGGTTGSVPLTLTPTIVATQCPERSVAVLCDDAPQPQSKAVKAPAHTNADRDTGAAVAGVAMAGFYACCDPLRAASQVPLDKFYRYWVVLRTIFGGGARISLSRDSDPIVRDGQTQASRTVRALR